MEDTENKTREHFNGAKERKVRSHCNKIEKNLRRRKRRRRCLVPVIVGTLKEVVFKELKKKKKRNITTSKYLAQQNSKTYLY